ncbi:unnamed protein product [Ectocarpus sp. 8 AP-2014]
MNGSTQSNTGVSLVSGSGIVAGDSVTLVNGGRQWRIRLPSRQESNANVLLLEYKSGAQWFTGAVFDLPQ